MECFVFVLLPCCLFEYFHLFPSLCLSLELRLSKEPPMLLTTMMGHLWVLWRVNDWHDISGTFWISRHHQPVHGSRPSTVGRVRLRGFFSLRDLITPWLWRTKPRTKFAHKRTVRLIVRKDVDDIEALKLAKSLQEYSGEKNRRHPLFQAAEKQAQGALIFRTFTCRNH